MSKTCRGVLFTLLFMMAALVCALPAASAQTVDDLVSKYTQARGGLDKIHSINSMRMTATMAMPTMEIPVTMLMKRPNSVRMEFTVQGSTGVRAFDGTTGWSLMPFLGTPRPVTITGAELEELRDQADIDGALVDYKAKGCTVELIGKEKIKDNDAYKLKLTRRNGDVQWIFLDATSYLDIKEEGKHVIDGSEREVETFISDYRDLNGMKFPFSVQSGVKNVPDQQQKLTIDKVELNVPLDSTIFRMPSETPAGK